MKKLKNLEDPLMKCEEIENEYKCVKCRDMTFIIDDGIATPCECRALREAEDILRKSGIGREFRNKRFDNFDFSRSMATMEGYKRAMDYENEFLNIENGRCNSIMFLGQVGSGKTHLSMAICNELMDRGISVIYMGYRDCLTSIKQNMLDSVYYNKVMNRYKNARVLFVDDLFKGSITGSDVNIMFEIINYRYLNGLPLIVSCEKSIEEIINIDEAIGSRLYEMSCDYAISLSGKRLNYRMYGKS